MLKQRVRAVGAALALLGLSALPAAAQSPAAARLGWLSELAGACWQGRDAAGVALDRQCYQMQFDSFLRGTIAHGELNGDSVLGWSRERYRLEMYTWANQGEPGVFTPLYDNGQLIFEGAVENGAPTRAAWRRDDADTFSVIDQIRENGAWRDRRVVTYRREGQAPTPFSANAGGERRAVSGWFWLSQLAGRCFRQIEPVFDSSNRGCFAWQYSGVMRQTWYWDGAATGETVMFRPARNAAGLRFYYWDAQGNFGVGRSAWQGRLLISMTDSADNTRRILDSRGIGFTITTEVLEPPPGGVWVLHHAYRFAGG